MRTNYFSSQLNISWLYFYDETTLIVNPVFGINPVDLNKEMQYNKKNIAKYKAVGNKMDLSWGDGRKMTINVEYTKGILSAFDGGGCLLAEPFQANALHNKVYFGLASAGPVTRTATIRFASNGTFEMNKLGAVAGEGNFVGVATAGNDKKGTYTIKGNTIHFKFSDGTSWIALAQPFDMGKDEIIINDQLFKKQ